jgi:hypothetical protein
MSFGCIHALIDNLENNIDLSKFIFYINELKSLKKNIKSTIKFPNIIKVQKYSRINPSFIYQIPLIIVDLASTDIHLHLDINNFISQLILVISFVFLHCQV